MALLDLRHMGARRPTQLRWHADVPAVPSRDLAVVAGRTANRCRAGTYCCGARKAGDRCETVRRPVVRCVLTETRWPREPPYGEIALSMRHTANIEVFRETRVRRSALSGARSSVRGPSRLRGRS